MSKRKALGFSGMVVANNSAQIAQLRDDIKDDFKKKLKKLDKKDKDKKERQSELLKSMSIIESWNKLGQLQQNGISRLMGLGQLAETSGPNTGKIVIPTTWNDKAQALFGHLLDNYLAMEVDQINGFSALRSMDLWTILAMDMGMGGFGDSLFGSIMFLQYMGQGLVASPLFAGLPGIPNSTALLLPRLLGSQISILAR